MGNTISALARNPTTRWGWIITSMVLHWYLKRRAQKQQREDENKRAKQEKTCVQQSPTTTSNNEQPAITPLPTWVSATLLGLASTVWYKQVPSHEKLKAIIMAAAFSIIEFSWYSSTVDGDDNAGSTPQFVWSEFKKKLQGLPNKCRRGHTTFDQFFANSLYIPFGFGLVKQWAVRIGTGLTVMAATRRWKGVLGPDIERWSNIAELALSPISLWMLEVIEGYALMLIHGRNTAWTYTDKYSFLHGNITLSYWHLWYGIGFARLCSNPIFTFLGISGDDD